MPSKLNPHFPFDALEATFRTLTSGPTPLCLDGTGIPGLPQRPIPLDELRSVLLHPSTSYPARDQALDVLLRRAQAEQGTGGGTPAGAGAVVGLVGVLLPGLRRAAWPLTRRWPQLDADIQAEVLTGLLTAIAAATPGQPCVASRLTWRARHAAEQFLRAETAERAHPAPMATTVCAAPRDNHPDLLLARAVAAGVLRAADAELIGATRVGEHTLRAAADLAGVSYPAIAARRRRAEADLLAWLAADRPGFVTKTAPTPGSGGGGRPRQGR